MFIRVDDGRIVNTDHVALIEWQENNPASSQNPQITLTLVSGQTIQVVEKAAGALWRYFSFEAKEL